MRIGPPRVPLPDSRRSSIELRRRPASVAVTARYRHGYRIVRMSAAMTATTTEIGDPAANPLREGLARRKNPDPCTIVLFGASGDLTRRALAEPGTHSP